MLDAGCGDGLLGLKALESVGETGKVIFLDISEDILNVLREFVASAGLSERAEFIQNSIDDMHSIPSVSVDMILIRSVLIYVADKQKCFDEFYRVLKPGGGISIFEPINSFARQTRTKNSYFGFDLAPLGEIGEGVPKAGRAKQSADEDPMINFDERDLIRYAQQAVGFARVALKI